MPDANYDGIDWGRWHDLLDIADGRGLTVAEKVECQRISRIVAWRDVKAARAAGLDGLVEEHERVVDSIRRATDKVRTAAKENHV